MSDERSKPSQVDATPEAGSPAPKPPEPGHSAEKIAETEARPDKAVPSDDVDS